MNCWLTLLAGWMLECLVGSSKSMDEKKMKDGQKGKQLNQKVHWFDSALLTRVFICQCSYRPLEESDR